jgi:lipopolysaccharide export system permease protein
MALLVFVLYFNLLNVGRSWVSTGQINVLPYLLGLHGGVFALAVVWLWVRHQNWSWPFWRPALAQRGTA